jgi:cobalt-precorrin 5A hydrolase
MAAGAAGHAMVVGQAVIAAGIGCKSGAQASDIEAAIRAALASGRIEADALDVIATIDAKAGEPGIHAAAKTFGVSLIVVPHLELVAANDRVETHSARVTELTGVGSVAEAAALAAAGSASTLIVPRIVTGAATCALAASAPEPAS